MALSSPNGTMFTIYLSRMCMQSAGDVDSKDDDDVDDDSSAVKKKDCVRWGVMPSRTMNGNCEDDVSCQTIWFCWSVSFHSFEHTRCHCEPFGTAGGSGSGEVPVY